MRIRDTALVLALRPELTAVVGLLAVLVYFAVTAGDSGFFSDAGIRNTLEVAASVGIVAAPVTLLMVAGEFDLSVGAVFGMGQFVFAYGAVELGLGLWGSVALAFVAAVSVGIVTGLLVVKTAIPSLIVTLAGLFAIRGATVGIAQELTDQTRVSGVRDAVGNSWGAGLFQTRWLGLSASFYWWITITAFSACVLGLTKFGNWILASGGDRRASIRRGVPSAMVILMLYMSIAIAAAISGILEVFAINQGNSHAGVGMEFRVAAAVVIGGALITGGYGSPVGSAVGSFLFGVVSVGFFFTNVPDQWFGVFLGVVLLASVMINQTSRQHALRRYLSGADQLRRSEFPEPASEKDPVEADEAVGLLDQSPHFRARSRSDIPSLNDRRWRVAAENVGSDVPLLSVRHVAKRYGPVVALEDVSFEVLSGRVTCLVGDNGAGKSTLVNILAGATSPDEGSLYVQGQLTSFESPADALDQGIATVFQDLALVPLMPVHRNFFVGREPTVGRWPARALDVGHTRRTSQAALRDLGVNLNDVSRPVATLSGGQRQSVEIARALHFGARVLILDEPTSALGVREASSALMNARVVADAGVGVVLITHNPQQAYGLGDRFTVLNRGRVVGTFFKDELSIGDLSDLMSGIHARAREDPS